MMLKHVSMLRAAGVRHMSGHSPEHAIGMPLNPSTCLRSPLPAAPAPPRLSLVFVFCTAETSKWKKISYVCVPFVCAVTVYVMGTHHHEHHEYVRPPPTPPPPLCAHLLSLPTHPEASHVAEQPERPSSIWPAMPVISPPLQVAYPFMKKRNKEYPWALQGGTQCTHYDALITMHLFIEIEP